MQTCMQDLVLHYIIAFNLYVMYNVLWFAAHFKGNPGSELVMEAAAYVLRIPGKTLDISALNSNHKFRGYGNKDGAVAAIKELEANGLGTVHETKTTRGTSKVRKLSCGYIVLNQELYYSAAVSI